MMAGRSYPFHLRLLKIDMRPHLNLHALPKNLEKAGHETALKTAPVGDATSDESEYLVRRCWRPLRFGMWRGGSIFAPHRTQQEQARSNSMLRRSEQDKEQTVWWRTATVPKFQEISGRIVLH